MDADPRHTTTQHHGVVFHAFSLSEGAMAHARVIAAVTCTPALTRARR